MAYSVPYINGDSEAFLREWKPRGYSKKKCEFSKQKDMRNVLQVFGGKLLGKGRLQGERVAAVKVTGLLSETGELS